MAAGAAATFRNDALDVVERALRWSGAPEDEDFWAQIQSAFVLDRNVVNFNNGGVCPSPRVVQDALRRQLEYSNQAPSYYMWRHLEPEIEAVAQSVERVEQMLDLGVGEIRIDDEAGLLAEYLLVAVRLQAIANRRGDAALRSTRTRRTRSR